MLQQEDLKATEFDKMTCSYNLQMLKAALSYFPSGQRRLLSLLIKLQELQNTVRLFSSPDRMEALSICSAAEGVPKRGFFDILSEIKDYGSPEQKKAFEQFQQFIQLSSLYEQMSQTSPQNSAASPRESPTGAPVNPSPDSDLGSQIRNSLPPEKQALFDSYRSLFHNT